MRLMIRKLLKKLYPTINLFFYLIHRYFLNRIKLTVNGLKKTEERRLEIGPGRNRIEGFETLNVEWYPNVDYMGHIQDLRFIPEGTFDIVYASHILEHVPWYKLEEVFEELNRILKRNGTLEIWVPNALKVSKALVDAEENGMKTFHKDGWYKFNKEQDPAIWFNGRMFSYGDGNGTLGHQNWHLAAFTPRMLHKLMSGALFESITELENKEVRGYDHGWINLGMSGKKK